ncbi:MAG: Rrf2 family transcriptional regulator [Spirochaetia bacterium]|nr:Rrf2 family transcriptional regulator [Spirochaetia bacterium]
MKISTRGRYAICALISLAERYGSGKVPLAAISHEQKISVKYLENIMRLFLIPGIVGSSKGKNGGFFLLKNPREIRMGQIVEIAEGSVLQVHCVEDSEQCPRRGTCPVKFMWQDLQEDMMKSLNSKTLYDLVVLKKGEADKIKHSQEQYGKRKGR